MTVEMINEFAIFQTSSGLGAGGGGARGAGAVANCKKNPAARKFLSPPPPPHNFCNGPSLTSSPLVCEMWVTLVRVAEF